ncbi:hypothetical protein GCK32_021304 [Trichostrongylus colubriformis]|uniref:Uncharacterized protein n=1 Tax=Trichostrongylus colubriformis TaxID=6319 RepID=A0AAN8FH83_TRICO
MFAIALRSLLLLALLVTCALAGDPCKECTPPTGGICRGPSGICYSIKRSVPMEDSSASIEYGTSHGTEE